MSSLSPLEKRKLEDLFGMASGYVLDFTDTSFSDFFRTTCKINIDGEKYKSNGTSKAKRLRVFWEIESDKTVGATLREMIQIWIHIQSTEGVAPNPVQLKACEAITARLLGEKANEVTTEEDFLKVQFDKTSVAALNLEQGMMPIIENRIKEAFQCKNSQSPLSTIFMCGSILEGLLLGAAIKHPKEFNQSSSAPKAEGKVKQLQDWKLSEFIDAAHSAGFLSLDVKKFSHALRDFRNYIHPYAELASGFKPDEHTADICLQVLKAAIASLSKSKFGKNN